jgi:putative DNA primase/helicase
MYSVTLQNKFCPSDFSTTITALIELQSYPHWIVRDANKQPYNPRTGYGAKAGKPETWASYGEAEAALEKHQNRYVGLGYEFLKEQGITGIDLDHCIAPDGSIDKWALNILHLLNSYAEYSPNDGIHVFIRGSLPNECRHKYPLKGMRHEKSAVEVYDDGRYFTITGKHVPNTPEQIEPRQTELDTIRARLDSPTQSAKQKAPMHPIDLSDFQLTERARSASNGTRFAALWQGDTSGYGGDDSSADQALCNLLAFWTGKDAARMDRLFRQSGLYREEKWDRNARSGETYGEGTIERAITGCTDSYDPSSYVQKKNELFLAELHKKQHSELNGKTGNRPAGSQGIEYIPSRKEHRIVAKEVPLKKIREYLEMNEYGDGLLFAEVFDGQVLYDASEKKWYLWKGHHWGLDNTGYIKTLVSGYLGSVYLKANVPLNNERAEITREIGTLLGLDGSKPQSNVTEEENAQADRLKKKIKDIDAAMELFTKRAKDLRKANYNKNVLYFAMSEPNIAITGERWDSNPWVLGVINGVLELKTGECRDGRPDDCIRSICPTEWKGLNTPCPRFEQFLQEIFDDRAPDVRNTLVSFFRRLFGYAITGLSKEAIFPIFYGEDGRNGKDTLFGVMQRVLGTAIADAISNDCIISNDKYRTGGAPTPHLMDLQGKRMVWGSETKKGDKINVSQIKQLTGGGRISGRRLNENQRSFEPTHTLFLMTNDKPVVGSRDKAFWERACMIKFGIRFVDSPKESNERKKDAFMGEKLDKEDSGILAFLVRGCLEYQSQGMGRPEDISDSTKEYRESEDLTLQFITEQCICREGAKVGVTQLWEEYTTWCKDNHIKSADGVSFKRDIEKRFEKKKGKTGWFYLGVGIIDLNSPEPTDDAGDKKPCHPVTENNSLFASVSPDINPLAKPVHSIQKAKGDMGDTKTQVHPHETLKNNEIKDPIVNLCHPCHPEDVDSTLDSHVEPVHEVVTEVGDRQKSLSPGDIDSCHLADLSTVICATRYDMMLIEDHEPAPDNDGVNFDHIGNMWCSKCHVQHAFMMLGADRGYPEVKNKKLVVVMAGQDRWLSYAKTMGYQYVNDALKLAQ